MRHYSSLPKEASLRYSTQTTTLAFSFLFILSPLSQAQSQAQSAGSTHESSDSSIPYESSNAEPLARKDRWSDFLPIWGAEFLQFFFLD